MNLLVVFLNNNFETAAAQKKKQNPYFISNPCTKVTELRETGQSWSYEYKLKPIRI